MAEEIRAEAASVRSADAWAEVATAGDGASAGATASRIAGAAQWASRLAPPQKRPAVAEDRHDAASHRPASHRDSSLGAEFRDPETEEAAWAEEEVERVEEADPPPEVEDPLGEVRERCRAEGVLTSRPSSRPRPSPPPQRREYATAPRSEERRI